MNGPSPQASPATGGAHPDTRLIDAAVLATGGARVALGLAALVAPRGVSRAFGITDDVEAARYLGGRDLIAGLGIMIGHQHGHSKSWLQGAAMVDCADTVVTLIAAKQGRIPARRAITIALVAAGGATSAGMLALAVSSDDG